jgi:predicted methyltransferase
MDSEEVVFLDGIDLQNDIIPVQLPPLPPGSKQQLHDLVTLFAGDCMQVMQGLADDCIDAIVTDPPYHLRQS